MNNVVDYLLANSKRFEQEGKERKKNIDFLVNEWKTNKHYFKIGGRATVEDAIRTAFEMGWSARGNFDYDHPSKE